MNQSLQCSVAALLYAGSDRQKGSRAARADSKDMAKIDDRARLGNLQKALLTKRHIEGLYYSPHQQRAKVNLQPRRVFLSGQAWYLAASYAPRLLVCEIALGEQFPQSNDARRGDDQFLFLCGKVEGLDVDEGRVGGRDGG